jgi:hypothetical protein
MNFKIMVSRFAALMAGLFIVANTHAQSCVPEGLVAYHPFIGNANDPGGSGNNGTVNGAVLTVDRFGNPNRAHGFNGVNNYIGFNSSPPVQTDNRTLTAWIQPATTNQDGQAVALGYDNGTGPTANGFAIDVAGPTSGQLGNQLIGVFGGVAGWNQLFFRLVSP